MEKFLKSIFAPEKSKTKRLENGEDDRDFTPPLDGRRKLSISRSGRMKQAQKKRHSLTMDLYGENYQQTEKPKSLEYHVNNPAVTSPEKRKNSTEKREQKRERRKSLEVKTPEEEIESAFEIIDKVL